KAEPMVKQKLATYVDNAIATIQTSHPDRKIILHKEFDENLEIYSNIFLEDIFANVFNNSLQSTNKKEITFTVKAKHIVKDKDSFWEISVEDNGSGISNGMKRQIEESFKTGQRIRGLGMMFIYRIVKAFQGDIRIENRVVDDYTQGTRIVFTLKDYTI
ncbi:MAG: sensor histidine kinase, partial [Candidatus Heimdallarchaeaceae archaeon]